MKNAFFLYRFHTGLIMALACVLVSFEWKTYSVHTVPDCVLPIFMHPIEQDLLPPITRRKVEPPKPIKKISSALLIVEPAEPEIPGPDPIFTGPDPDPIDVPDFFEPTITENVPLYNSEILPEFPGGLPALYDYLSNEINYSKRCREAHVEGKVFVKFTVSKDGSAADPVIVRGIPDCPELEKEVLKAIANMPNWKPGKQNGREVSVFRILPVSFSLQP